MGMIIAGVFLIAVALVDKGNSFAKYGSEQGAIMVAMLVGGFVWIAVGYLLHNLTKANEKKADDTEANEKKAKSLDQNRE
jgi:H+/gluconate symporter-like permease